MKGVSLIPAQERALDRMVRFLIPHDQQLDLPPANGASTLCVASFEEKSRLAQAIGRLADAARAHFSKDLADLADEELFVLEEVAIDAWQRFCDVVRWPMLEAYFLVDEVAAAFGIEHLALAGPETSVHAGDLTLLEGVYRRGPIYRPI